MDGFFSVFGAPNLLSFLMIVLKWSHTFLPIKAATQIGSWLLAARIRLIHLVPLVCLDHLGRGLGILAQLRRSGTLHNGRRRWTNATVIQIKNQLMETTKSSWIPCKSTFKKQSCRFHFASFHVQQTYYTYCTRSFCLQKPTRSTWLASHVQFNVLAHESANLIADCLVFSPSRTETWLHRHQALVEYCLIPAWFMLGAFEYVE